MKVDEDCVRLVGARVRWNGLGSEEKWVRGRGVGGAR